MMMEENFMAMLQFPQPKLVEKTGEGTWRLTGRVILPEDGSLDRAAARSEEHTSELQSQR